MKRWISIFIVLIIFFGMGMISFGQASSPLVLKDAASNKNLRVVKVNLKVNGKNIISSDVPPIVSDQRTLVPVRFMVENLGAEISWNQKKYEATVTTSNKTIVLKINSPKAYVNGRAVTLPDGVPAKLLSYKGNSRTVVPLRFISEELGMNVGWMKETMTATVDSHKESTIQSITDITYSSAASQVVIKTTGSVNYKDMYLKADQNNTYDRLVLDISNSILKDGMVNQNIGSNGIESIRASLFATEPQKVSRIVIDLKNQMSYDITFDKNRNEIKVDFKGENPPQKNKKIIVLDAGHGGSDGGAPGINIAEKVLALDTVKKLGKLLENGGYDVYLTRSDDTYVGLYDRAKIANNLNADIFVSIHYNSYNEYSTGIEVLYNPNKSESKELAQVVQEEMIKELNFRDRGIKERPKLVVLNQTQMPAILVEAGFISNPKDAAIIETSQYRQQCAEAIYNGIVRYFNEVK